MSSGHISLVSDRSSRIRLLHSYSSSGNDVPGSSIYTSESLPLIKNPEEEEGISTGDPSWIVASAANSSSFHKPALPQTHPHRYPDIIKNQEQEQEQDQRAILATGIEPHAANVPGLIRRGSSRRKGVVRRAPSIRSERNRVSVITEADDAHTLPMMRNSSITRVDRYGFHVPKKPVFKFMPFVTRRASIRSNYQTRKILSDAFDSSATELQLKELYQRNKREPLILQQYSLQTQQKFQRHPKLSNKLKSASIDLTNRLCLEDASSDIIDLYFLDYPVPHPPTPRSTATIHAHRSRHISSSKHSLLSSPLASPSASPSPSPTTSTERGYRGLKQQVFDSKLASSKEIFAATQIPDLQLKRLALTIYLRRLMAAKIALRMSLEKNYSSSSFKSAVQSTVSTVSTDDLFAPGNRQEYNLVRDNTEGSMVYMPPDYMQPRSATSAVDSLRSPTERGGGGGGYDSLVDLSFPSSAGSRITFHSFK